MIVHNVTHDHTEVVGVVQVIVGKCIICGRDIPEGHRAPTTLGDICSDHSPAEVLDYTTAAVTAEDAEAVSPSSSVDLSDDELPTTGEFDRMAASWAIHTRALIELACEYEGLVKEMEYGEDSDLLDQLKEVCNIDLLPIEAIIPRLPTDI